MPSLNGREITGIISNMDNEFSIKLYASRECPICEFPSALNIILTQSSMVLQCQTCKKEWLYLRVKHIVNDLMELKIQE